MTILISVFLVKIGINCSYIFFNFQRCLINFKRQHVKAVRQEQKPDLRIGITISEKRCKSIKTRAALSLALAARALLPRKEDTLPVSDDTIIK